jgi:hypothetical protein
MDLRRSWLEEFEVSTWWFLSIRGIKSFSVLESGEICSHLVQLGAGRGNLLDAELTELSLELSELLGEVLLVLPPELTSLNLA